MYTEFVFKPIYNALVYIIGVLPHGDVGIAVVILTLLIRIILLPLSQKAQKTTRAMRALQPQLDSLKKTHGHNPQKHMEEMRILYKDAGVSPFSSIFLMIIQLPILLGLYKVFHYGHLLEVDSTLLYPYVHAPAVVSTLFLGSIDVAGKSIFLALCAGVAQYAYAQVMPQQTITDEKSFANDFARSMQLQMKYVFPLLMVLIAYSTSAAIALYLIVSSLASLIQEMYNRGTVWKR